MCSRRTVLVAFIIFSGNILTADCAIEHLEEATEANVVRMKTKQWVDIDM